MLVMMMVRVVSVMRVVPAMHEMALVRTLDVIERPVVRRPSAKGTDGDPVPSREGPTCGAAVPKGICRLRGRDKGRIKDILELEGRCCWNRLNGRRGSLRLSRRDERRRSCRGREGSAGIEVGRTGNPCVARTL